jgi:hypothetical protein
VYLASRNVVAASEIFAGSAVQVFQAPLLTDRLGNHVSEVRCFVDILHNVGFGSARSLLALTSAWSSIYSTIRPDVIVFDHSPTALAASYDFTVRRVLLGTGFACPPPDQVDLNLRTWLPMPNHGATGPSHVLDNLNGLRRRQGLAELASVGQLFSQADATLLNTFEELDHFQHRRSGHHIGVFPLPGGRPPEWPCKARQRAFVYHKPHSLLQNLARELTRQEVATILYTGSDDSMIVRQYSTKYVRVTTKLVDLPSAMAQADFAILNGTHVTTAAALLAGIPTIHFPLVLEQWMFAQRVKQLGAGDVVTANSPQCLSTVIEAITTTCIPAAQRFAATYASFDPQFALRTALASIETATQMKTALCG